MTCARSIGISALRATHAVSRAEARYSASVNPAGSSVMPTCSIPIDPRLTTAFPECQAMSERWTICTILPSRLTMKCAEPCERSFFSHVIEPQNGPSVAWMTTQWIERHVRLAFV